MGQTITSFTVLDRQRIKREYEAKVRQFNHDADEAINESLHLRINSLQHQVVEKVELGNKLKSHHKRGHGHRHRHKRSHKKHSHGNRSKVAPATQEQYESLTTASRLEDLVKAV